MPHEILNDPIDVTVDFVGNRVRPKQIRWGRHTYPMHQVNLVHNAKEGNKRIFYFSVSDKSNFMKLRFDTESMEWRLVEFYTDG
jgi:hypothetical protein